MNPTTVIELIVKDMLLTAIFGICISSIALIVALVVHTLVTTVQRSYKALVATVERSYKALYGVATGIMIAHVLLKIIPASCNDPITAVTAIVVIFGMMALNHRVWTTFILPRLRREEAQQAFQEVTDGDNDFLPLHDVADWQRLDELFKALDITFDANGSLLKALNKLVWKDQNVICESDFVLWYVKWSSKMDEQDDDSKVESATFDADVPLDIVDHVPNMDDCEMAEEQAQDAGNTISSESTDLVSFDSSSSGLANLQITTEDDESMIPVEEDSVEASPVDTSSTALVLLPLCPQSENLAATTDTERRWKFYQEPSVPFANQDSHSSCHGRSVPTSSTVKSMCTISFTWIALNPLRPRFLNAILPFYKRCIHS